MTALQRLGMGAGVRRDHDRDEVVLALHPIALGTRWQRRDARRDRAQALQRPRGCRTRSLDRQQHVELQGRCGILAMVRGDRGAMRAQRCGQLRIGAR